MTDTGKIPPIRGKKKIKKKTDASKKEELNKNMKDKIYERVAREEKAYRIVERLIDNPVSMDLLRKSLNFINQSVYNDIADERSIIKNCGFPLCGNTLPKNLPKQTYKIDSRMNKVYKLEERIKFCSNMCFSYSRKLRDQLSTEPVWLVHPNAHKNITIIPPPNATDNDVTEELPSNQKIDEKYLVKNDVPAPSIIEKQTTFSRKLITSCEINVAETLQKQFDWLSLCDESEVEEDDGSVSSSFPKLSFLGGIRQCLMQWKTPESCHFLSYLSKSVEDDENDNDIFDDLLDDDLKIVDGFDKKAPLPEISELHSEHINIEEKSVNEKQIILPNLDSVNQSHQRHNIVLQKIQAATNSILSGMKMTYSDISLIIMKLLPLLSISSKNCMYSERDWLVISTILLRSIYPLQRDFQLQFSSLDQFDTFLFSRISSFVKEKNEFFDICNMFCAKSL